MQKRSNDLGTNLSLKHDGVLTIATGRSRKELEWKNREMLWSDLIKRLSKTVRTQFTSGAVRDMQEGKGRCDLLPPLAILRLARHFEMGAKKYGDRNWEKGILINSFIDSAIRHIMKYMAGQQTLPETLQQQPLAETAQASTAGASTVCGV